MEPPCGQLNPTQSGMFDVLEAIFTEMLGMFGVKQFHMGGDEIHLGCWNSSEDVVSWLQEHGRGREEADIMFLWSSFLQESVKRIQRAGMTPNLVYWTNGLTKPEYISYLDPNLFSVQIWSNGQVAIMRLAHPLKFHNLGLWGPNYQDGCRGRVQDDHQ